MNSRYTTPSGAYYHYTTPRLRRKFYHAVVSNSNYPSFLANRPVSCQVIHTGSACSNKELNLPNLTSGIKKSKLKLRMEFTESIKKIFNKSKKSEKKSEDDLNQRLGSVRNQVRILETTRDKAPSIFGSDDADLLESKQNRLAELEALWNQSTSHQADKSNIVEFKPKTMHHKKKKAA